MKINKKLNRKYVKLSYVAVGDLFMLDSNPDVFMKIKELSKNTLLYINLSENRVACFADDDTLEVFIIEDAVLNISV